MSSTVSAPYATESSAASILGLAARGIYVRPAFERDAVVIYQVVDGDDPAAMTFEGCPASRCVIESTETVVRDVPAPPSLMFLRYA